MPRSSSIGNGSKYRCTYVVLTGKAVNKIADVLQEVDWVELAGELSIGVGTQNSIRSNCNVGSNSMATCYRRELVQNYCDLTGLELKYIVENISKALEGMKKKQQANTLRREFGVIVGMYMSRFSLGMHIVCVWISVGGSAPTDQSPPAPSDGSTPTAPPTEAATNQDLTSLLAKFLEGAAVMAIPPLPSLFLGGAVMAILIVALCGKRSVYMSLPILYLLLSVCCTMQSQSQRNPEDCLPES